ncbi:unnamed protein product [Arctia plantaginis]|uniref:ODAD1 central coiled coil region domain-containing protein n=1 Tax=Arctia plantaginis TaxID=874455 RepID=A0A8S1BE75_ARCPL|nr:unnamed protein product [Arctia plantaginis]
MPTEIKEKCVDPEAELSKVQRTFENLAPLCSVKKRAEGIPQLAPQEKQIAILKNEMRETLLCINLAKKGRHALRDAYTKRTIHHYIKEYECLEVELTDERAQQTELDLLNYLSHKVVADLTKQVPSESDELAMLENANNSLRRMENRLDMATKRFCIVNTNNQCLRSEIHRLLVERNDFNILWKNTIDRLMKGKVYLMDILEIASNVFMERDECCRKLEDLKWRGLMQLNKDISEMKAYEFELNHLAKLEEFLRVKGSLKICEADEIEEAKRLEEIARCEQEIARHDTLLEEIFEYTGCDRVATIIRKFKNNETETCSMFILLCEILQESIKLRHEIEDLRNKTMDFRDWNEARDEKQDREIAALNEKLNQQRQLTQMMREKVEIGEVLFSKVLKGIEDLVRLVKCEVTPLLKLLGNQKEVTRWNVYRFIKILEMEVKSIVQVVYGAVKPPAPTPKSRKQEPTKKLVADPHVEFIRPNRIEKLVPYQPCAYCVEDYIMNLVFETPAVPADKKYVESIFRLEDVNTNFGIFTLTIPAKRHPFRGSKKN